MKLVVQDASVLIDLSAAELLEAWFSLGIETLTTSFVWREVNRRSEKERLRQHSREQRIKVVAMPAEVLSEVVRLKMDLPRRLTLQDASVLHLAISRGAVLLTGDRNLRSAAEDRGVQVHGLLWVLEYMVTGGALQPEAAAKKLDLLRRLNPRLPEAECESLRRKWSAR